MFNIVESDLCEFCMEEIETLNHIFLECEAIKPFWKDIQFWIAQKLNVNISVELISIMLGIDYGNDQVMKIICKIYLAAKQYVYKCRCTKQFPSISNCVSYKKTIKQIEKCFSKFKDIWSQILL